MNYLNINSDNYNLFIKELYNLQDLKYRDFHSKLLVKSDNLIGIRVPILKDIAKKISKGNYKSFLKTVKSDTYEEIMIYGLVIGYIKENYDEIIKYLNNFIPLIDNWAINDTVAANLKIFKKDQEKGYEQIKKYLTGSTFSIRFGLVLLLDHYINDNYIDDVLNIAFNLKNDEYYVKMANSWLISICYIKYPNKTLKYLNNNSLDVFTHNKAISKICDSYQVDKRTKEKLKKLKK